LKNNFRNLAHSAAEVTNFHLQRFPAKVKRSDILRVLAQTNGYVMTDGLLDNIIELEKRIQSEVAAEQTRAEEWHVLELTGLQSRCAEGRIIEEARRRDALAEQEVQLKGEGAALEESASDWCQRLLALNDEMLRDVLKRHLAAILPGGDYDHPHGQS
jgi:hypothetical protein